MSDDEATVSTQLRPYTKPKKKRRKSENNRGRYRMQRANKRILQSCNCSSYICSQPAEIILNIFCYLSAKDLIACRVVCYRWKLIVDTLYNSSDIWSNQCKLQFSNVYEVAHRKAVPGLTWYNLYRSLTIWNKLNESLLNKAVLTSASCEEETICNFEILRNGIVGVHKKGSIVYYDLETMKVSKRKGIAGSYLQYRENDYMIAVINHDLQLFITRKDPKNQVEEESRVVFRKIKLCSLRGALIYFVNLENRVYVCDMNQNKLKSKFVIHLNSGVMAIGYSSGYINFLDYQLQVFSLIDNELEYMCSLGPALHLFHQLYDYNFYEYLDWRVYFQWMYLLNNPVPNGPLTNVIIIRPYGNVFFIGSNMGVLRIYYAPLKNGDFDVFNYDAIKVYNFMRRGGRNISMCPILQIDVFERVDGHTVLVAIPEKIAILNFKHNFKKIESVSTARC